ncbi:MAG TPA: thiol-disulfide isomerase [Pirellulaceae bacterium]|nr:thiol-disulfide isomerase [Pirellulaceae bacterium]
MLPLVTLLLAAAPNPEVIVFLGTECPMARLYVLRLNDLANRYPEIRFRALNASDQDSAAEVAEFGKRLRFPYEKDDGSQARRLSATRSPEAFLLVGGRIVYRGRIDDQYTPGTNRGSPTRHDLEEAIKEVLAGRPVSIISTQATGCRLSVPVKPSGEITFDDVAPILHQKCAECHRPGQVAPFPLLTYEDTLGWGAMIEEVVATGRMPPWHADPAHGHFANDRSLTAEQKELLLEWVAAGSPAGRNHPLPPSFDDGWKIRPDRIIAMDRFFQVPAEGVLDYQEFTIDPGFRDDTWVQAVEIRPGNPAVVHHINVFLRPPGAPPDSLYLNRVQDVYLAMLVPGNAVTLWPEGIAKLIPAGWNIVFSVHYQPNGTVQTDRSQLALQLADAVRQQAATRVFVDLDMLVPPRAVVSVSKTWKLEDDFTLYALYPHMHLRGKSMIFEIISPQREVLLNVPRFDFNWQHRYVLSEPRKLAKGTVIECRAVFDNTAENPHNPDPGAIVRFGPQSTDEMFQACFEVVRTNENLNGWPSSPWVLLSAAAVISLGYLVSRFCGRGRRPLGG